MQCGPGFFFLWSKQMSLISKEKVIFFFCLSNLTTFPIDSYPLLVYYEISKQSDYSETYINTSFSAILHFYLHLYILASYEFLFFFLMFPDRTCHGGFKPRSKFFFFVL